jgi:hypothetical protein
MLKPKVSLLSLSNSWAAALVAIDVLILSTFYVYWEFVLALTLFLL